MLVVSERLGQIRVSCEDSRGYNIKTFQRSAKPFTKRDVILNLKPNFGQNFTTFQSKSNQFQSTSQPAQHKEIICAVTICPSVNMIVYWVKIQASSEMTYYEKRHVTAVTILIQRCDQSKKITFKK